MADDSVNADRQHAAEIVAAYLRHDQVSAENVALADWHGS